MSDLHVEFGPIELPTHPDDKDTVLILAGDIGIGHKPATYLDFFESINDRFSAIVYILGNHEHYNGKFTQTLAKIRETLKDLNDVHVLEKETLVIDDIAFVCATLWTDFDRGDPMSMFYAQHGMNDFKIIRIGPKGEPWRRKFSPNDAYADFSQAKNFIFEEVVKYKDEGKTVVVVTHHAPSHESSAEAYKGLNTAGAYASDLHNEIETTKPKLWIHGHMHSSADYMIGDTRVVLNPRGYAGYELNLDFDPLLTIEV